MSKFSFPGTRALIGAAIVTLATSIVEAGT